MPKPKFSAGERVEVASGRLNENIRPGVYTVLRVLPVTNEGLQYRVKSALDTFDRIINEERLHALGRLV